MNTNSNKSTKAAKFIASYVEVFMEDGDTYAVALGKAEREAMKEGLIPSPERNARIRKDRFHNAIIGEAVPVAKASLKRRMASCRLDADCLHHDAEFVR